MAFGQFVDRSKTFSILWLWPKHLSSSKQCVCVLQLQRHQQFCITTFHNHLWDAPTIPQLFPMSNAILLNLSFCIHHIEYAIEYANEYEIWVNGTVRGLQCCCYIRRFSEIYSIIHNPVALILTQYITQLWQVKFQLWNNHLQKQKHTHSKLDRLFEFRML